MILVCAGRGRPQIPLQEQVLMLLHFVAHKGKYGLLADKFGITRSCYFSSVDELLDIVATDMLRRLSIGRILIFKRRWLTTFVKDMVSLVSLELSMEHTLASANHLGHNSQKITSVCARSCTQCCSRCLYAKILDPLTWRFTSLSILEKLAKILDPPT